MSGPFQKLIDAILADDPASVKVRLLADPGLARQGRVALPWFEPTLAHWIYHGDTALHLAAAGYREAIASLLLAAGAECGAAHNHRLGQPLHYVADGCLDNPEWTAARQVAMIRLLLQAGADIQAPHKNGATPLHRAVRTRSAAAVKCLLAAGADPAIRNKPGSTAFHLAVQNSGRGGSGTQMARSAQREIIQAFLEPGVSPALMDSKGKSVLDWARQGAIRQILESHAG